MSEPEDEWAGPVRERLAQGWRLEWKGYAWEILSPDHVIRGVGRTPLDALASAADRLWCTIVGALT